MLPDMFENHDMVSAESNARVCIHIANQCIIVLLRLQIMRRAQYCTVNSTETVDLEALRSIELIAGINRPITNREMYTRYQILMYFTFE